MIHTYDVEPYFKKFLNIKNVININKTNKCLISVLYNIVSLNI